MTQIDNLKRNYLLGTIENIFLNYTLPKIPNFISTVHLTLLTIFWSLIFIVCCFVIKNNNQYLWLLSLIALFQYITDTLDGAWGRYKKEGFVNWGYFADHFLDFTFGSTIIIGYSLIFPQYTLLFLLIFIVFMGYFITTLLTHAITKQFSISYLKFGPSEVKATFIILNIMIWIFGKGLIDKTQPILYAVIVISILVLFVETYKIQKQMYILDLKNKNH